MGRNEIKLRRQRTTARGVDRFRNYASVLQRHEQEQKLRKVIRVFIMFAVILILIMIIFFLSRWEENDSTPNQKTSIAATALPVSRPAHDYLVFEDSAGIKAGPVL